MTAEQIDRGLGELLAHIRETRGFDFTSYKNSTVERRISKRMADVGIEDYAGYLDHLQVHPDEFVALFDTFLINVTGFFRDPEHWTHLRHEVIPEIIRHSGEGHIRAWSAGCSSGPEAYTITMLFAEALGLDAFRGRVKIYARTSTRMRSCRPARRRTPHMRSRRFPRSCARSTSSASARDTCFTPISAGP